MSTSRGRRRRSHPGARRRARERALDLLYEAETKGIAPDAVLGELQVGPDPYAAALVHGVAAHLGEIDALIAAHATAWSIDRLPAVDRQLLRIAAYEIAFGAEVPAAVAIDEAVGLAREFSTEESGRYVNGVLAAIATTARPLAAP
ncbi:MAG: transcription antitermination factor NusB [Acidimicrobiales bacterium]